MRFTPLFLLLFSCNYSIQLHSMFAKPHEKKLIVTSTNAHDELIKLSVKRYKNILMDSNRFFERFAEEYKDTLSTKDYKRIQIIIANQNYSYEKIDKISQAIHNEVSSHQKLIGLMIEKLHANYSKKNLIDENAYINLQYIHLYLVELDTTISKYLAPINPNNKAAL
jgi:hypothetical protein